MNNSFQSQLLQQFAKKKSNAGFTLIELLVVIIIIGILSAIALPSFLNQASKAKESEAKTYAGSVNRAQQAYRLENTKFASTIDKLGVAISDTDNYEYKIDNSKSSSARFAATPQNTDLKAFSGCVEASDGNTSSEIKESESSSGTSASPPKCQS